MLRRGAFALCPGGWFYFRKEIDMFRKIVAQVMAAAFMAGLFGSLAGCNTMEGAGKDIERGGAAIKDEARENKRY